MYEQCGKIGKKGNRQQQKHKAPIPVSVKEIAGNKQKYFFVYFVFEPLKNQGYRKDNKKEYQKFE
ncbi:MAG: hypothetical protein J6S71_01730 [Clostridia bacterium]|nr:hypothetical protein [Clostridia bacterium]